MPDIVQQFIVNIRGTGWAEWIAVASGLSTVYFSKKENILVYPTGLVSTVLYVYLSFRQHLLGEMLVNVYYTVMSIYGWIIWTRKNARQEHVLKISFSTKRETLNQAFFFLTVYLLIFSGLEFAKKSFAPGALPAADGFASATAFTGMWLMTRKKVESWYWWIATNIASIPLYYVKGFVMTSVLYVILFFIAVSGLKEWKQRAKA